jgi:hypothetical protein
MDLIGMLDAVLFGSGIGLRWFSGGSGLVLRTWIGWLFIGIGLVVMVFHGYRMDLDGFRLIYEEGIFRDFYRLEKSSFFWIFLMPLLLNENHRIAE